MNLAPVDDSAARLDSRLTQLVSLATRATLNTLLERVIALTDSDVMAFVNALQACGMIADESGHLLPELFCQVHHSTHVTDSPTQQRRLLAALAFEDADACIHGRSLRAEALEHLAVLVRGTTLEPVTLRNRLVTRTEPRVYRELLAECQSFHALVKSVERRSIKPPAGDPWWAYQYYDAISTFESLAKDAMVSRTRRS
jgi:hypothetical protein